MFFRSHLCIVRLFPYVQGEDHTVMGFNKSFPANLGAT
jgi:hypothetical protein